MSTSPDRIAKDNPYDPIEGPHEKAWDVNFDGLAHIGMLPDFIQDLRQDGVSDAQLRPLFRSAEGYVRMWELAERTAPVVTAPAGIAIVATKAPAPAATPRRTAQLPDRRIGRGRRSGDAPHTASRVRGRG